MTRPAEPPKKQKGSAGPLVFIAVSALVAGIGGGWFLSERRNLEM